MRVTLSLSELKFKAKKSAKTIEEILRRNPQLRFLFPGAEGAKGAVRPQLRGRDDQQPRHGRQGQEQDQHRDRRK